MTWGKRVRLYYDSREKISGWYESGQKPKTHYKRWFIIALVVIAIAVYLKYK